MVVVVVVVVAAVAVVEEGTGDGSRNTEWVLLYYGRGRGVVAVVGGKNFDEKIERNFNGRGRSGSRGTDAIRGWRGPGEGAGRTGAKALGARHATPRDRPGGPAGGTLTARLGGGAAVRRNTVAPAR